MECVTTCSVPRAVVDAERTAKRRSPGMAEYAPRGDYVSGGIADTDTAEVDDRAEPAAINEQVGPQQVRVYPHGCSVPRWCFESARPSGSGRIAVYHAARRLDRHARRRVELTERLAPTPRRSEGIYSAQFDHELCQIIGSLSPGPWPMTAHAAIARRDGRRAGRWRSPSLATEPTDWQVGQLGELCGNQPLDELLVDIDLPRMHLHSGSRTRSLL